MTRWAWWLRFCLAACVLLLVAGACSDASVSPLLISAQIPPGGLFLGCPEYEGEKDFGVELANGATAGAGATRTSFSVSGAGDASVSFPIEIPPGRAGLEPSLSIVYSSSADESYLGLGFSIAGLSAITRCPKNIADDGEIEAVADDLSDAFCLDGKRLVNVGGNEYRTVPDTFSKIVVNANASGPQSFTVFAKSGLVYEYGGEDSAKVLATQGIVRSWLVSKIHDRNENAILFKYQNDRDPVDNHTLEFAPLRIDYTDHPASPASRAVVFQYGTRDPEDIRTLFARGMKLRRSLKLNAIQTLGPNDSPVRDYRFLYAAAPNTKKLLLTQVEECAADQVCKPATKFRYFHGGQGVGFDELATNLPGPSTTEGSLMTLDATGDGLDDLLIAEEDPQSKNGSVDRTLWRLLPNERDEDAQVPTTYLSASNSKASKTSEVPTTYLSAPNSKASKTSEVPGTYFGQVPGTYGEPIELWLQDHVGDFDSPIQPELGTPIDYNHDGRMDILLHDIRGQYPNWRVLLSNGTQPFQILDTGLPRPYAAVQDSLVHLISKNEGSHLVDVNGDGMPDMIHCRWINVHEWSAHLWTPQGFDPNPLPIDPLFALPCHIEFFPADIDADGQLDVLVPDMKASGNGVLIGTEYLAMSFKHQTNAFQLQNTGLSLNPPGGRTIFLDINGDGLPDALQGGFADRQLRIFVNTGKGFSDAFQALDVIEPELDELLSLAVPIDWNGDGRQDLLIPFVGGLPQAQWFILQSNGTAGNGAFTKIDPGLPLPGAQSPIGPVLSQLDRPRVTDIDGDGIQDIVLDVNNVIHVFKNKLHGEEDRLRTVTDGMNPWDENDPGFIPNISIEYDHLIDRALTTLGNSNIFPDDRTYIPRYNVDTDTCAYPMRCVVGPRRAVSHYALYQGGTEAHDYKMVYRNGRYDRLGRGFLGFSQVTTRDLDTGAGSSVYYDNLSFDADFKSYPFAGVPIREIHWNPTFQTDPETEAYPVEMGFGSNWFEVIPTNNNKSFFVLSLFRMERRDQGWTIQNDPLQIEYYARDAESNPADTIALSHRYVLAYDQYGNILSERATTEDQFERTLVEREVENNTQDWLIGLVKKETTCSESNGEEQCQVVERSYDQQGKLQSEYTADQAGTQNTQLYLTVQRDKFGNPTLTTLKDGFGETRPSCVTYDSEGIFVWATSNGANLVEYYKYDPGLGILKMHEDPNGLISKWRVDGFGRIQKEHRPDGVHTNHTMTRTKDGGPAQNQWNIKLKTLTPGHQDDIVQLDAMGRVVQSWTQKPYGLNQAVHPRIMQLIEYDALGERITKKSLPDDENTQYQNLRFDEYEYDGFGRLVKQIAPWGAVTKYRYSGRTVEVTAPGGVKTLIQNDQLGRPEYIWENKWTLTAYEYGPFQSLKTVTETGTGAQTIYERDALGRVTTLHDPDRGITTSQYNGFGNVLHSEDALGRAVDFLYDRIGRTMYKHDADGDTVWVHDQKPNGKGRLGEVISPGGHKVSYGYDSLGRLSKTDKFINGELFSTGVTYDIFSRIQAIQYPDGFGIERLYDPYGRLQKIKQGNETLWQLLAADGAGRTIYEQFGTDVTTVREYFQDRNRLKHIHTSTALDTYQELEYAYDDRLNLSFRKDLLQGKTESFVYDKFDRVTDVCLVPNAWQPCWNAFQYDPSGNLTFKADVGSYEYEFARPHVLSKAGGQAYIHDAVGNLVQSPGMTLAYTAFDLPSHVSLANDELYFDYDGHQERIRKYSQTRETVYVDGLYERVSDSVSGEVEHRHFVYNDERLIAVHTSSNQGGNDLRYIHTDHLGSTDVVTDSQGQVVERQSFSVFGSRRNPQWGAGPLQSGPPGLSRGFTGHEGDDELGLINMRGRMMSPYLGRFITPDPLISNPQLAQGWNPFVYALNSPLSEVDPSGFSVVTAESQSVPLSQDCQCYKVTVHGPPRAGAAPKAVIPEQNEMGAAPAPVDLGTAGIPSSPAAADPTSTEIPEHYIENDFGHNASEAAMGVLEGLHELTWESGKAMMLDALTLGGYTLYGTARDVERAGYKAWVRGRWAGFSEDLVDIANRRFNPLYAIGERSFFAYLSAQSHDWRGAFRHGTIATVLTILAVVTAGKGISGALKKGNGAAGLGAAEEAATKKAVPNPNGSRGSPLHRAMIEQRIKELKASGHEHLGGGSLPEEVIPTPGGIKASRRPDITTRTPQNTIYRENVGKSKENGAPIARERGALDDIESATGSRPGFTPYDK